MPDRAHIVRPPRTAPLPDPGSDRALAAVARRYAVSITPAMRALVDTGDPEDPIARQFLPSAEELSVRPDELADPIGDDAHEAVPGLVHRYPDRVLVKLTPACAVYCRFCFRRETVGPKGRPVDADGLAAMVDYVAHRPAIWEVILSGGDPLVLSPSRLGDALSRFAAIPHIGCLRLHSRVPAVDPGRVDDAMLAALRPGKAVWLALHVNHPRELTEAACEALARLADAGIALVSQTVLLAGVNDDAATLEALFRKLVAHRVKPYYLHHLDRAPGTARFRVSLDRAQSLTAGLRGRVSGLCQPSLMVDIPGGHGKVPVGPCHAEAQPDGGWIVTDPQGRRHRLAD